MAAGPPVSLKCVLGYAEIPSLEGVRVRLHCTIPRPMLRAELDECIRNASALPPEDRGEAAYACACSLLPVSARYKTPSDCSALWMTACAAYVVATTQPNSADTRALYDHIEQRFQLSLAGASREELYTPLVDFPPKLYGFLTALSQLPPQIMRGGTLIVRQALLTISE
jgi:hypothetical protein